MNADEHQQHIDQNVTDPTCAWCVMELRSRGNHRPGVNAWGFSLGMSYPVLVLASWGVSLRLMQLGYVDENPLAGSLLSIPAILGFPLLLIAECCVVNSILGPKAKLVWLIFLPLALNAFWDLTWDLHYFGALPIMWASAFEVFSACLVGGICTFAVGTWFGHTKEVPA